MKSKKLSTQHMGARAYHRKGIDIILLNPETKIPLAGSNGCYSPITELEEIDERFNEEPNFNIGMPTGPARQGCGPAKQGFVVLDVDWYKPGTKEAVDALEAVYGPFRNTLRSRTPRGGESIWLLHPSDGVITCKHSFNDSFPGAIDAVKGKGGYIVLPPSIWKYEEDGVAKEGEYRWVGQPDFDRVAEIPEWMYQFFGPKRDAGGRFIAKSTDECSRLAQPVDEGGRHERMLIITGILLRIMRPQAPLAEALVHGFNRGYCNPPLPTSEVQQIFEDIANKELSKLEKALSGGAR